MDHAKPSTPEGYRFYALASGRSKKKGESFLTPLFQLLAVSKLEGVSPVEVNICPVAAVPATRRPGSAAPREDSQVVASAESAGTQVRSVVPQEANTDAHARG